MGIFWSHIVLQCVYNCDNFFHTRIALQPYIFTDWKSVKCISLMFCQLSKNTNTISLQNCSSFILLVMAWKYFGLQFIKDWNRKSLRNRRFTHHLTRKPGPTKTAIKLFNWKQNKLNKIGNLLLVNAVLKAFHKTRYQKKEMYFCVGLNFEICILVYWHKIILKEEVEDWVDFPDRQRQYKKNRATLKKSSLR